MATGAGVPSDEERKEARRTDITVEGPGMVTMGVQLVPAEEGGWFVLRGPAKAQGGEAIALITHA